MKDGFSPWAEVDLDAIAWNVGVIRRRRRVGVRLLVAVKANGYGHGAAAVARVCLRYGAEALGVARLEEGIALREAGIAAPILIFGLVPASAASDLQHHALTATVACADAATRLDARAKGGARIPVHLKLDTGMGRLGGVAQPLVDGRLPSEQARCLALEAARIAAMPHLLLQGVYTHFPCADESDHVPTETQHQAFMDVLREMASIGVRPLLRHAANSAAIFLHPKTHLDMVRAGIAVYGCGSPGEARLRPAMTLKTRVMQVRRLPAGATIGYGMTYRTTAPSTIATVGIGYGDGYDRRNGNLGRMLVRGKAAPIVGRVCMDLTLLDVTCIPGVSEGDETVVFGRQGRAVLSADSVAETLGTIPYEVTTSLTARVATCLHETRPANVCTIHGVEETFVTYSKL